MLCKRTNPLPMRIECVVRGYLSGSGLKDYRATGKVCGIGDVQAAAVAADLHHLRAAAERLIGHGRVRVAATSAEPHRAGLAGGERVADVVLLQLPGAPAGHVQPAVI